MTSNHTVDSSRRFYARLLGLYPREFRNEYGASMLQVFTDQCRSALQDNGIRGMVFLWVRTLVDLTTSVLREHITSPGASLGLMEAVPNAPLPWKGVGLVLIPCLVFFIGQIGQLAGQDWFYLLVRRASFYLIVPVLIVWLLTRKFPIWGLIPLGMFYRNILDLTNRIEYVVGKTTWVITGGADSVADSVLFRQWNAFWGTHITEIKILVTTLLVGTTIFLVIRMIRSRSFARLAWVWTGTFLIISLAGQIQTVIFLFTNYIISVGDVASYQDIPAKLRGIAATVYFNLTPDMGFLLLILIGGLLAWRHGRVAVLLPLGYIIPTVVLGRFDNSSNLPYSLLLIGASVLAYRVLVTLVAPIWILRSASDRAQRRAGSIALPVAVGILLVSHVGFLLAGNGAYGGTLVFWDFYYSFAPDLKILAGMALAITLYKSTSLAQTAAEPLAISTEMTSG